MLCSRCGLARPDSSFSNGREYCFACHLKGLQFKFTYGKEAFHGPTGRELAERERKLFRKKMGYDPLPYKDSSESVGGIAKPSELKADA